MLSPLLVSASLLQLKAPRCVPWLESKTLCMWASGEYRLDDIRELLDPYESPPCSFDTGDYYLPSPCRLKIGDDEWMVVRIPRLPQKGSPHAHD
jgi:hypothetical protein